MIWGNYKKFYTVLHTCRGLGDLIGSPSNSATLCDLFALFCGHSAAICGMKAIHKCKVLLKILTTYIYKSKVFLKHSLYGIVDSVLTPVNEKEQTSLQYLDVME